MCSNNQPTNQLIWHGEGSAHQMYYFHILKEYWRYLVLHFHKVRACKRQILKRNGYSAERSWLAQVHMSRRSQLTFQILQLMFPLDLPCFFTCPHFSKYMPLICNTEFLLQIWGSAKMTLITVNNYINFLRLDKGPSSTTKAIIQLFSQLFIFISFLMTSKLILICSKLFY